MPRFLLLGALLLSTSVAAAQPYRPVDLRRAERPASVEGGENLPLPEALELAYQLRLDNRQLDRVIARAGNSGDPTLIPTLWRLARAYAPTGYFSDQIFEALRRLGERDEAFIAEAERVGPTIPDRPAAPPESRTLEQMFEVEAISGFQKHVGDLVQAAAARPDSAFLPRVVAVNQYTLGGAEGLYRIALAWKARVSGLPIAEQVPLLAMMTDDAFVGRPALGAVRASHEFRGVLPFGPALHPEVVWSRERLAALYQQDPAAVTAGIDAYLATADLGTDAADIRAYLVSAASVPPPAPLGPTCNSQPATIYVSPAGLVLGGPLAGQPYAGRLTGTPGPDVIVGTDAADVVEGLDGNDIVCAGSGGDAVDGGPGTDAADGGPGTDGCDAIETASACEQAIPLITAVRPVGECFVSQGDGFTAYFGYENLSGQVGRIPHGRSNAVRYRRPDYAGTEEVLRVNPTLFALPGVVPGHPGQTPPFPRAAFAVDVASDPSTSEIVCEVTIDDGYTCYETTLVGSVSWTLLGQTVNVTAGSLPECPAP